MRRSFRTHPIPDTYSQGFTLGWYALPRLGGGVYPRVDGSGPLDRRDVEDRASRFEDNGTDSGRMRPGGIGRDR